MSIAAKVFHYYGCALAIESPALASCGPHYCEEYRLIF